MKEISMSEIKDYLREAIAALEKIRDEQSPPDRRILERIDKLYELDLDRIEAEVDMKSVEYQVVCDAMGSVSGLAREYLDDMAQIEDVLEKVDKAVELAMKLNPFV